MSKLRRATPLVALALALAVPASTFAVSGSATVAETLTVTQAAAISVSGLPSSVDLGAALPGSTTPDTDIGTATITMLGGVTTFNVTLTQSALTSGPNSIPASASSWSFDKGSGYLPFVSYPIVGTIYDQTYGGSFLKIRTHWAIPGGAAAGAYSGSLTVTATGS